MNNSECTVVYIHYGEMAAFIKNTAHHKLPLEDCRGTS